MMRWLGKAVGAARSVLCGRQGAAIRAALMAGVLVAYGCEPAPPMAPRPIAGPAAPAASETLRARVPTPIDVPAISRPSRWSSAPVYRVPGTKPRLISQSGALSGASRAVFSADGHMLATVDLRGVAFWDVHTGRLVREILDADLANLSWREVHGDAPPIAFSADGARFILVGRAGLRAWDTRTGKLVRQVDGTPEDWTPRQNKVLVKQGDGRVVVVALEGNDEPVPLPITNNLTISADGARVAGSAGAGLQPVLVFDSQGRQLASVSAVQPDDGAVLSEDGARLAVGSPTGATIFSVGDGSVVTRTRLRSMRPVAFIGSRHVLFYQPERGERPGLSTSYGNRQVVHAIATVETERGEVTFEHAYRTAQNAIYRNDALVRVNGAWVDVRTSGVVAVDRPAPTACSILWSVGHSGFCDRRPEVATVAAGTGLTLEVSSQGDLTVHAPDGDRPLSRRASFGVSISHSTSTSRLALFAGGDILVFDLVSGSALFRRAQSDSPFFPVSSGVWQREHAVSDDGGFVAVGRQVFGVGAPDSPIEYGGDRPLAIGADRAWVLTPESMYWRDGEAYRETKLRTRHGVGWHYVAAASSDGRKVAMHWEPPDVDRVLAVWDGRTGQSLYESVLSEADRGPCGKDAVFADDIDLGPNGEVVTMLNGARAQACRVDPAAQSAALLPDGMAPTDKVWPVDAEGAAAFEPGSGARLLLSRMSDLRVIQSSGVNGGPASVLQEIPFDGWRSGAVSWLAQRDFVAVSADGRLEILDLVSSARVLDVVLLPNERWVAFDRDGRFDTNDVEGLSEVAMTAPNEPLALMRLEPLLRPYYTPGLVSQVLYRRALPAVPELGTLNFVVPDVEIVDIAQSERGATVRVRVRDATGMSFDGRVRSAGPRDVRLFRDGRLVGRQPAVLGGSAEVVFEGLSLPSSGEVSFSAYAFNDDGVKSETARKSHVVAPTTPTPPRAYIINIGINAHAEPSLDLDFAVADAEALGAALELALKDRYDVRVTPLLGAAAKDPSGRREALLSVLRQLSGTGASALSPRPELAVARPEDLVIVTFGGHGATGEKGLFYLLFGDYDGQPLRSPSPVGALDDETLALEMAGIDAGEIVFVVDACQSASAVERDGIKPGPLGAKGFGQMAYDKRMRVLAGAQADNVSLEAKTVGHGLLTYALLEGLQGLAAKYQTREDALGLSAWLSYGAARVPSLADTLFNSQGASRGLTRQKFRERVTQQPRLFDDLRNPSPVVLNVRSKH